MDELVKYAITNGPFAVGCALLAWAYKNQITKNDKLQDQITAFIKEGGANDLIGARALDALGNKIEALATIINRLVK